MALTSLLDIAHVAVPADNALASDVPAVPVGSDGRELPHPTFPSGRVCWRGPKTLHPTLSGFDGLVGQRTGSPFHGLVTFAQGLRQLGVAHTLRPRDEAGDQVVGFPVAAAGCLGPALHPTVQYRGNFDGVGQGPTGH